jgi:hypothetical protein
MTSVISPEARQDLLGLVAGWCARHAQAGSLEEAETLAEEARYLVGQAVLEAGLRPQSGQATYQGRHRPCSCGAQARFVGYRARWIRSVCGEVRVQRAYYHCAACRTGHLPWDEAQGLTGKPETPRLKAVVCQVMGRLVYAEGVALLADLCRVCLEESTAEAIVREVGAHLRAVEKRQVETVQKATERATEAWLLAEPAEEAPPAAFSVRSVQGQRLYVGADATTAHIGGGWHNVQNGLVFTVRPEEKGRDRLWERAYLAGRMDMESLGWRLRTLAVQWNVDAYPEVVFLGDGAPCNWNLAATHFPEAVPILDFWHASEHVWAVSRTLYRQDDPAQKALGDQWATEQVETLKTQGPAPLLRALGRRQGKTPAQKEALRLARHYFTENAARMDYPGHLAAGRMIGSGPVEAACKSVVGVRLKQAGMRWSEAGADAVLAVRTTLLNGEGARLAALARAA